MKKVFAAIVLAAGVAAAPDASSTGAGGETSYTLKFVSGSNYDLFASMGGGPPHRVQLDTGSRGLFVPKGVLGSSATISATETCATVYVSSGKTLSGHMATGPVTLLGSTAAGDVNPPPSTVPMSFCAVDDPPDFVDGMMGVGFGRGALDDPAKNVLLQISEIRAGSMRPGFVLSTFPSPNMQIGITTARSANFQMVQLSPSPGGNGDWVAASLKGCLSLPSTPAFKQECGGLLVDTGVGEVILWGPSDPTLGGIVPPGGTSAPFGTSVQITTQAGPMLDFSFALGAGVHTPSSVDIRTATAFSTNTGRALLVDYDYLFDAQAGLVGFQRVSPAGGYASPYAVSGLNAAWLQDLGSLVSPTLRLYKAATTTTPGQDSWYDQDAYLPKTTGPEAQGVTWGPMPLLQPQPQLPADVVADPSKKPSYYQQRFVATAYALVGTAYQHHHDPAWKPLSPWYTGPSWPWSSVSVNPTSTVYEPVLQPDGSYKIVATKTFPNPYADDYGKMAPGIDCSDLASLAYNAASGVFVDSAVATQGNVTVGAAYGGKAPIGWSKASVPIFVDPREPVDPSITPIVPTFFLGPHAAFSDGTRTPGFNAPGSLDSLVGFFKPGDLLYVVGRTDTSATVSHVVIWLGPYGTNADGTPSTVPLVVNSHDNTPALLDASGNMPPPGVEILPFAKTSWLYTNFSHAMRVVDAVPAPVPPTPGFTYSPASPAGAQVVTFTDTSTGSPAIWSWTFGDGYASSDRNPTHAYSIEGLYTVMLVVTNAGGSKSTSQVVRVGGPELSWVLPSSAFRSGADSAEFHSDVRILNLDSVLVTVAPTFFDQASGETLTAPPFPIAPRSQAAFDNILQSLFGRTLAQGSYGPIRFNTVGRIQVSSGVNNVNACGTGAVSGQWLPGPQIGESTRAGLLGQLAVSASTSTGYRTNAVFQNPGTMPATARVNVRREDGTLLSSGTIGPLGPNGFRQVALDDALVFPGVAGTTDTNLWMEFTTDEPVLAFASVINNASGDPFAIVASADAWTSAPGTWRLPSSAFRAGANGAEFHSDVRILNPGLSSVTVTATLLDQVTGTKISALPFPIAARSQAAYDNILASLFGRTLDQGSYGPILFQATSSILVSSGVNNVKACGTGAVSGQWLPGVAESQAMKAGTIGQLAVSASSATGYRTNLVFVNPGTLPATVLVKVRRGDGSLLATGTIGPLGLDGFLQVPLDSTTVFPGVAETTDTNLWLEFTSDQPVVAFASVINNASGDPFSILAVPDID